MQRAGLGQHIDDAAALPPAVGAALAGGGGDDEHSVLDGPARRTHMANTDFN